MNRDETVDDLQGYKCWAVGWGKTASDGSGDYSNQVSWLLELEKKSQVSNIILSSNQPV